MGRLLDEDIVIDVLIGISGSKSIEELTEECEVYQSDNRCWSGGVYGAIRAIKALPPIQHEKAQLSQEGATSDLISRQAAIDAAKDWYEGLICGSVNGLIKRLNALPPAQPEPQEGHWIEGGIYRDVIECNCSECGQLMTTAATVRMNFCPNCGAKMRGEQHETD